ncbi:pyrimidine 5'-nucleotidase [Alterisphingorhabdus coralli]|uniref:Pyrimidine 5'-nucleotidase n=1 Tax=Alterisphingorhabdus coralli TaxID=3071408 RepID=A0AA97F7Q5_9SPHN|nr:pyrimidine 5'-nucleotidase [Parasphingorhabdus sp. SCSIO 66989]WOE75466.1 pyrimidine 5'-nucleotidase [Parasphingorhabdus sp. SCSIO 66989]
MASPTPSPHFDHVRYWVFDLDNTLYSADLGLFDLIDVKMGRYISELLGVDAGDARIIQKRYFRDHGTTLAGLMHHHGIDPHDFLEFVHDIDMAALDPRPDLARQIADLPGEKYIFTNADATYAAKVLERLGLSALFSGIHDIHATRYQPKPEDHAYDSLIETLDIDPRQSLFFEDMARNLLPAKKRGMATVWIDNGSELGDHGHDPEHIDLHIKDLSQALATITASLNQDKRASEPQNKRTAIL